MHQPPTPVCRQQSNRRVRFNNKESPTHHRMKITLAGAAGGEVTGSCYIVETEQARILLDCGLFQGGKKSEALNRSPTPSNDKLDAVLITHGQLDHVGRLPLLTK